MCMRKKTQYGGDVVMFLPIKIIKNKKLNYLQKLLALHIVLKSCNKSLAHGFKTMCNKGLAHGFKTMCKAS